MRVVVTGAGGLLGAAVVRAWSQDDVTGLTRAELDVTDAAAVRGVLGELAPEVVVHCAAWTAVDECEDDPVRAQQQNADAPGAVAAACAAIGARMVHVSTDYVHDGPAPLDADGRPQGWRVDDPTSPRSVYGRTKLAGEHAVRAALPEHHIVRTAWVNGATGPGFVRTMLDLAARGRPLLVVDDQVGNPTFAPDLAVALRAVARSDAFGTWNRTNDGSCSWHELATATFDLAGLDVDCSPVASAAFPQRAPRPSWSVLDPARADAAGLPRLPPWRDALAVMLDELGVR